MMESSVAKSGYSSHLYALLNHPAAQPVLP
jgi:hypothetical protein